MILHVNCLPVGEQVHLLVISMGQTIPQHPVWCFVLAPLNSRLLLILSNLEKLVYYFVIIKGLEY